MTSEIENIELLEVKKQNSDQLEQHQLIVQSDFDSEETKKMMMTCDISN
jgi:hypothetical protein